MEKCVPCDMKRSVDDLLFLGHHVFIKEACPECKKPIAIMLKHKKNWGSEDKYIIHAAFFKHLYMKGTIDWDSKCFKGHPHCHFTREA